MRVFTRVDYQTLSDIVRFTTQAHSAPYGLPLVSFKAAMANRMADEFDAMMPRFNRSKFLKACGEYG